MQRNSCYKTLLRVTAYVLILILSNCQVENQIHNTDALSAHEIKKAESKLLHGCQGTAFSDEISSLKCTTPQLPLVKQLHLFLDDPGCIRFGGRIHNRRVDDATKFPYLLPKQHQLTRLIVRDAHEHHKHSSGNATVAHIHYKFWILVVSFIVRTCVRYRRANGKPYSSPDPLPLPTSIQQQRRQSIYLLIYVCHYQSYALRSCHQHINWFKFLQAFRRVVSQKSLTQLIISDNATTFQSASAHMKTMFESTAVRDTFTNLGTDWQFISKRVSWYGEWWERLVGLSKAALKKIVGRAYLSLETLQTVVTEIETIMNDCPLTYVSTNTDDPETLTPAHFVYGRRITAWVREPVGT